MYYFINRSSSVFTALTYDSDIPVTLIGGYSGLYPQSSRSAFPAFHTQHIYIICRSFHAKRLRVHFRCTYYQQKQSLRFEPVTLLQKEREKESVVFFFIVNLAYFTTHSKYALHIVLCSPSTESIHIL